MKTRVNHPKEVRTLLKPEDFEKFQTRAANSTCQTLTEYARALLLKRPVRVFYRNKSLDELVEELIVLRRKLEEDDKDIAAYQLLKQVLDKIADLCMHI